MTLALQRVSLALEQIALLVRLAGRQQRSGLAEQPRGLGVVQSRQRQLCLGHRRLHRLQHLLPGRRVCLPGQASRLLGRGLRRFPRRPQVAPRFVPIAAGLRLRCFHDVRLCHRVVRPQGGDRRTGLAGLLDNLGQFVHQPLVRHVRVPKVCQHPPHGPLVDAEPAAGFGDLIVRTLPLVLHQRPHLLRGKTDDADMLALQRRGAGADITHLVPRRAGGHSTISRRRRSLPWWPPRSPFQGSSAPPRF
jgi:hypothetical protein